MKHPAVAEAWMIATEAMDFATNPLYFNIQSTQAHRNEVMHEYEENIWHLMHASSLFQSSKATRESISKAWYYSILASRIVRGFSCQLGYTL
jgi:hypothetical protein